jgi:hypothetical protein
VIAREAEAQMYMDVVAAEEEHAATAAEVAAAWVLVDGDKMEVEDDDEAEAERDAKLRVAEAAIHTTFAQREAELAERATAESLERRITMRRQDAAIRAGGHKNPKPN